MTLVAGAASAEPQKLTFSVFEPPQAFGPAKVYGPWAQDVTAASGGTMEVEMLAGGQLGAPAAQLEIVQNGVADIAIIIPSFTPGRFPGNEIAELPFLWDDPTVAGIAVTRLVEKGLLKYPGVKVLAADVTGPYQVHASKPVNSLDDMKGLRLRAAGPVFAQATALLGATPVGMPTPSVAENISRGVLDGTLQDWTLVNAFRIIDATPHHFDFPMGGVTALLVMNQQVYDELPDEAKAVLEEYGGAAFARRWGDVLKAEERAVREQVQADPDQTAVSPDAAEAARWTEALQPVVDDWAAKSPENAALLEAFKAELDAAASAAN
ncbi:TRAP transporter substrate-binding protein [Vannielia litorea]|uniref:TRAP transporter substrate-binding protein n=1 Tax=Vannielia litorea TaxID=1217970 RepID=UPI001BCE87A4|nr:TRAP transporter substrate-binding protein [Vannielia litorea]